MLLSQKTNQNFNQKIYNWIGIFDIISRDIVLIFLHIFNKKFDYFDDRVYKLKKEIWNLLKSKNHIIDKKLWYCIIDKKLYFAEFGISGRKYMIASSSIYIWDKKQKYISITHKSDNIYDIKLSNGNNIICKYANWKFTI